MADIDETTDTVLDAIKATAEAAKRAADDGIGSNAQSFGAAASDLAEAYAWLTVPNQPH